MGQWWPRSWHLGPSTGTLNPLMRSYTHLVAARRRRPRAPQPGPVGQAACLSETPVAFVRWYLCRIETFIACAGEKWAFVVQFLGAEVSSVSVVPC